MKRSKIFLGLTTGILAVAGVAVAKNYSHTRTAYYVTTGNKYCQSINTPCTKVGGAQCFYTVGTPSQQLVLFTQGPAGLKVTNNCAGSTIKVRLSE